MKEAAPTGEVIAQQWLGSRGGEGVEEGLLFATAGEGDPAGLVQVRGTLWLLLAMHACYGSGCHDHATHSRQCLRLQQTCMASFQEAHAFVALRHAAISNPCPAPQAFDRFAAWVDNSLDLYKVSCCACCALFTLHAGLHRL